MNEETHIAPIPGEKIWMVQKGKRKTAYAGYTQLEVIEKEKKRGG